MRYGLIYRASLDVLTLAEAEMRRLSAETGETVQVCGLDGDTMIVLAMAEGRGPFRISSDVGSRVPLNWTASGRLLLGHLPDSERRARFAATARPSASGGAETDPQRLSEQAARDFAARLAVQISASDPSVACIAAPICQAEGACAVTISIVLPVQRAEACRDELGRAVGRAALAVEASLGA